jgi:hypothetical protein
VELREQEEIGMDIVKTSSKQAERLLRMQRIEKLKQKKLKKLLKKEARAKE